MKKILLAVIVAAAMAFAVSGQASADYRYSGSSYSHGLHQKSHHGKKHIDHKNWRNRDRMPGFCKDSRNRFKHPKCKKYYRR